MLPADLDRTPLELNSIDMDLASGRYLNKTRQRIPDYAIEPVLSSCPRYAVLIGRAAKLLSRRNRGQVA
jgi:hypothetical protein